MMTERSVKFFALTDTGRVRERNEDSYLVDARLGLFIVADGMGGHNAGEVASALCVRAIHEEVTHHRELLERYKRGENVSARELLALLEQAVQRANACIYEEARADAAKRGMGTTCVVLLVVGPTAFVAHVGDSRAYLARGGKIEPITDDHTVRGELMRRGKLTAAQLEKLGQKNAITRAVGVYERVEVDTLLVEIVAGDAFLLCSDGLTTYLKDDEEALPYVEVDSNAGVEGLVRLANERGGKDNVTVVVVHVGGEDDAARARKLAQKRSTLAKMPLFSRLSERELLRIMQVATIRHARSGEAVVREGERGDELFIVLEGHLRVSQQGTELTMLGPGAAFGEMALVRNTERSATVTAEGPVELIVVRRADFLDIVHHNHELAIKLLWQFVGMLAERLEAANESLRSARASLTEDTLSELLEQDSEGDRPTLPWVERAQARPRSLEQLRGNAVEQVPLVLRYANG